MKKRPVQGPLVALDSALLSLQRGWMIRSGKKRNTSIVMPAVRVNQTAATTGAVVRNFFMGLGYQRGETVTLESDSTMAPLVNSLRAARGQTAAARVVLKARGRSIWISRMVASLLPRMAIR